MSLPVLWISENGISVVEALQRVYQCPARICVSLTNGSDRQLLYVPAPRIRELIERVDYEMTSGEGEGVVLGSLLYDLESLLSASEQPPEGE